MVDISARECMKAMIGVEADAEDPLFDNIFYTRDALAAVSFTDLAPLAYKACRDGVYTLGEKVKSQHDLAKEIWTKQRKEWARAHKDFTEPLHKVHNRIIASPTSRLWLDCRPNRAEYMMRRVEYEVALRARYLLPPSTDPFPECVCGKSCPQNEFVVHALDCKSVSGYTWASRHAHVKRVFKSVLRQYGFLPDATEPRFMKGGTCGPDVCFLLGGTLVLVDVTVVNPLAPSYVDKEVEDAGSALQDAEARKDRRYLSGAEDRRMDFQPLALSVFGQLGPASRSLIRRLGTFTATPGGFEAHMETALSVAVQVGNARILMAATATWWRRGVR